MTTSDLTGTFKCYLKHSSSFGDNDLWLFFRTENGLSTLPSTFHRKMGDKNEDSLVEETEPSKIIAGEGSTVDSNNEKVVQDEIPVGKPNDVSTNNTIETKNITGEDKSTKESKALDSVGEDNLHYEDGVCIYTEPESKCQFVWDEEKQEWVPKENPSAFSDKDYEYDGKTYTYTDSETGKFC